jgi:hypothetical protein
MSSFHQIIYRAAGDIREAIEPAASSYAERSEISRWQELLDPWLRVGAPPGRGYLNFGTRATFLRWRASSPGAEGWELAHVLVGPASTLTTGYALQLPELPAGGPDLSLRDRLPRIGDISLIQRGGSAAVRAQSRSAAAVELLVPMLSRILAGDTSVTVPWTEPLVPEAALWGLASILAVLGDNRSLSFMTYAVDVCPAPPGLFVSFNSRAAKQPLDQVYGPLSIRLATSYADAGRPELEHVLAQHRVLEPADQAGRIARLLELWASDEPSGPVSWAAMHAAASPQSPTPGGLVICPMCLSELDWSTLPQWRWDGAKSDFVPIEVPPGASRQLRAHLENGAVVRCPNTFNIMQDEHYLPSDYGNYGPPVVLGFVGLTKSGKSHLLSAMLGEIERSGLDDYGIRIRPIDYRMHKRFLEERVYPLIREDRVLPRTVEGIVTFADAFLVSAGNGPERPVALFDVAGGELTNVENTKRFLNVADGLIFVVDPDQLDAHGLGDEAFNTVLSTLRRANLLPDQVSAAIVLNKADLIRFEDPITLWLRSDGKQLDAEEITRESADVYAYLESRRAEAWTRPYRECAKATLHVASPTGGASPPEGEGGKYPRGVTPRRVLRPLVALLAMTGLLTGPQAERVGI